MNSCGICGYPIMPANVAMGYAGPVCPGHAYFTLPIPYPAPQLGLYGFMPATPEPLTADDIRKIVREELERTAIKPGAPREP